MSWNLPHFGRFGCYKWAHPQDTCLMQTRESASLCISSPQLQLFTLLQQSQNNLLLNWTHFIEKLPLLASWGLQPEDLCKRTREGEGERDREREIERERVPSSTSPFPGCPEQPRLGQLNHGDQELSPGMSHGGQDQAPWSINSYTRVLISWNLGKQIELGPETGPWTWDAGVPRLVWVAPTSTCTHKHHLLFCDCVASFSSRPGF